MFKLPLLGLAVSLFFVQNVFSSVCLPEISSEDPVSYKIKIVNKDEVIGQTESVTSIEDLSENLKVLKETGSCDLIQAHCYIRSFIEYRFSFVQIQLMGVIEVEEEEREVMLSYRHDPIGEGNYEKLNERLTRLQAAGFCR